MLGCDRNPGPLNFIIIGPSVDNLCSRYLNFKDIYVQENTSHRSEDKILRKKTFHYCLPGALWLGGTPGNFSVGPFK